MLGLSKSRLAIELSKLEVFSKPSIAFEQYPTDSEIAADMLNFALLNGDIKNKIVADFGAGTGILGIGALLEGAKFVYFIERDKEALEILTRNLKKYDFDNYKIFQKDINLIDVEDFSENFDMILQNPPFGTQEKHADKDFLQKAIHFSDIIYSFHKKNTSNFVSLFSKDNGFEITHCFDYEFPLKKTMNFHKKRIQRILVSCFRLEKK